MSRERMLDLAPRIENQREKKQPKIILFELSQIKEHFDENIDSIQQQFSIANDLIQNGKQLEAENIWRAQIVFLDSAFDFYMHEITQYGLIKMFKGEWEKTEKYNNILVKMNIVEEALRNMEDDTWFMGFVNHLYSTVTMMSFESLREQLRLLNLDVGSIADKAFYERSSQERTRKKLERRVNELFFRRNLIAHQSDRLHQDASKKQITKELVEEFIEDLKKIVQAIHEIMIEKV